MEVFSLVVAGDESPLGEGVKEILLCTRAKGEGGSKSVKPNWCSGVIVGTWNDVSKTIHYYVVSCYLHCIFESQWN